MLKKLAVIATVCALLIIAQTVALSGADTGFADNSILRMDIDQAMSGLPRDEREIIFLHLNGSLSFARTAEIVSLSMASTYRGRFQRFI